MCPLVGQLGLCSEGSNCLGRSKRPVASPEAERLLTAPGPVSSRQRGVSSFSIGCGCTSACSVGLCLSCNRLSCQLSAVIFSGWAQVIVSYCREEGEAKNKPCESTVRRGSAGEWTHTGQWCMAAAGAVGTACWEETDHSGRQMPHWANGARTYRVAAPSVC